MKNDYDFTNPYDLARFLKDSEKKTPVKLYVKGKIKKSDLKGTEFYGAKGSFTVFCESDKASKLCESLKAKIKSFRVEFDRRNSAVPLLDTRELQARIEPGAFIREGAVIGNNAVVMMGAVINLGAVVGEGSMIDMGAVLGARVQVGKNCHVGAGAVLAGVLEPPSAEPVRLGDGVLIGANAVVLEGVSIGDGAVVAAGSVVTKDVVSNEVVAGSPAVSVKMKDAQTEAKTEILDDLRSL